MRGTSASTDFPKGPTSSVFAGERLSPMVDPTTGKTLLKLPPGFRYFSFAHAGEMLTDGSMMPSSADGMGLVSYQNGRARFIRNQEIWDDRGYFALPELAYDVGAGGGTVTLDVDLTQGKLLRASPSLTGTNANCSGGVTPWGSWLSGEEQVVANGEVINSQAGKPMPRFTKPHGFMFEVTQADPSSTFKPIPEMGQMRHEAAAIDASSGIVYLTEDNQPAAGFFRFIPKQAGKLALGGKLQMLAVDGITDLRTGIRERMGQRRPFKTRWVDIADPLRAHHDQSMASNGCFMQGVALGGASFTRLEGVYIRGDEVFFTATSGGDIAQGQVFVYRPKAAELELIYESADKNVMTYPDAIEKGPDGGHVICQDGKEVFPQALYFLSANGKVSNIAQINAENEPDIYSEWSGCSMSPDGQWLFANVYTPGYSVAITGPFDAWAKAHS
jgi:uncharacterized protein